MHKQFKSRTGGPGQTFSQQLTEIHANALPGVTRPEEGEELLASDPDVEGGTAAQSSLRRTYEQMEQDRERARYEDYLDEVDSDRLPNAFDLGWRRNLKHLFGDKPLLWPVPICNTSGDGWTWEPNVKWLQAREELQHERERTRPRWQRPSEERYDGAYDNQQYSGGLIQFSAQDRHFGHSESRSDSSLDSKMSLRTFRRKESFSGYPEEHDGDHEGSGNEEAPLNGDFDIKAKPNILGQKQD